MKFLSLMFMFTASVGLLAFSFFLIESENEQFGVILNEHKTISTIQEKSLMVSHELIFPSPIFENNVFSPEPILGTYPISLNYFEKNPI